MRLASAWRCLCARQAARTDARPPTIPPEEQAIRGRKGDLVAGVARGVPVQRAAGGVACGHCLGTGHPAGHGRRMARRCWKRATRTASGLRRCWTTSTRTRRERSTGSSGPCAPGRTDRVPLNLKALQMAECCGHGTQRSVAAGLRGAPERRSRHSPARDRCSVNGCEPAPARRGLADGHRRCPVQVEVSSPEDLVLTLH